ncbi:MAG TPA: FecR domain-containing protein [Sphingomonas sp.]|nr:FecR domain-containing protein [Sphingomonas sp.]HWU92062.1 FecR domain-containing protein [Sphingomicrobium sp.]
MNDTGNDRSAAQVRREAAEWIARMHGPERETSLLPFERWRAADPRHRAIYAEMEQIAQAANRLGAGARGVPYRGALPVTPLWRRPGPRLGLAGVAAALLIASTTLYLMQGSSRRPPQVAISGVAIETPVGQIRAVKLGDGTMVTLDAESAIRTSFSGEQRLIRLIRGRARFDVARDATRPFVVMAMDRTITDKGTVFDVEIGRDEVGVTLLRGAVEIREPRDAGLVSRLEPGQSYSGAKGGRAPVIAAAPLGGERWVGGTLNFDGAPLGTVVEQANRYARHKIRLGDPDLATLRATGSLPASAGDGIADMLAEAFELRVARDRKNSPVLYRR